MTTRTSTKTVTFKRAAVLDGVDGVLPPGDYVVETDEELLEGLSFLAYQRAATMIHVGVRPGHGGVSQTCMIDPDDLEDTLAKDRAASDGAAQAQATGTTVQATEGDIAPGAVLPSAPTTQKQKTLR